MTHNEIDYTNLKDPEFLIAVGVDASKWATAFSQMAKKHGINIDEGWMVSWFANAMMAMHDHMRPDLAPIILPDGSAIAVH